jgi:hypothetical protein
MKINIGSSIPPTQDEVECEKDIRKMSLVAACVISAIVFVFIILQISAYTSELTAKIASKYGDGAVVALASQIEVLRCFLVVSYAIPFVYIVFLFYRRIKKLATVLPVQAIDVMALCRDYSEIEAYRSAVVASGRLPIIEEYLAMQSFVKKEQAANLKREEEDAMRNLGRPSNDRSSLAESACRSGCRFRCVHCDSMDSWSVS